MIGLLFRSVIPGPCAICAGIGAIFAIFGCVKCMRCRLRDCACCKRFLRATGHDEFDDFELMMLVHEAIFERREAKFTTVVKVTAGRHHVSTDPNSNGIFQQPLQITVEQGTDTIVVDLMDSSERILASLVLNIVEDVLNNKGNRPEQIYNMKQKNKGIRNPKIKLTMVIQQDEDVEKGLLAGASSDVDNLVRLQLAKARGAGQYLPGEGLSEMDVLKEACAGPLELFEGLGKTSNVWVSVLGPPKARRWVLGIYADKHDFDMKRKPVQEIDLLRVESVQADHTRHHVFVLNYYDESRVRTACTFRRSDRARDVWVEIIRLLVQKVHDTRKAGKSGRARGLSEMPQASSSAKGRGHGSYR